MLASFCFGFLFCFLVFLIFFFQKMWDQEKDHLKKFNELMVAFRVRPTILMPLWNVAGFALGKCLSRSHLAVGDGLIIHASVTLIMPSSNLFYLLSVFLNLN